MSSFLWFVCLHSHCLETPKGKYRMCDDFLSCDHHRSMIISLQFLGGDLESTIAKAASYRFLVLGLGGGLLAKFL